MPEWKVSTEIKDVFRVIGTDGLAKPGLAGSSFGTSLWRGTTLIGSTGAAGTGTGTIAFTISDLGGSGGGTGGYQIAFTPDAVGMWHSVFWHDTHRPEGWVASFKVVNNSVDDVYSRTTSILSPIGTAITVPRETTIEVVRGDDRTLNFTALDADGAGIALGTGWFSVKELSSQADGLAIISKSTGTAGQGSVTGTNTYAIYLVPSDYGTTGTAAIQPDRPYRFDAQVRSSSNKIFTVSRGTFLVRDDVQKGSG